MVVPLAVPLPPAWLFQLTWVIPILSDAVPPRVTDDAVVVYVATAVGVVMVTTGFVVSAVVFDTVTVTDDDVVVFPA